MARRILIVGAGAVGSYLGGWLKHTGHDVTLLDPWGEHVEAIRRNGISLSGPHEPFVARPAAFHLHETKRLSLEAPFETVFVAVKSYDTAWAVEAGKMFLAPGGYVVSSQNCWNDTAIAAAVGAGNAVGLVMSSITVALPAPGKVMRAGTKRRSEDGYEVFRAGEHDGRLSPRIRELVQMLEPIDGARITDNLWGERWAKLCQNCMGNPVTAASGMGSADVSADRRGRELTIRLAWETARVGIALGHKLPAFGGAPAEKWASADRGDVYEELDAIVASRPGSNWRPSMAQDVQKGRPTEINEMNGFVAARARQAGVEAPVTQAMVAVVREIDAGTLKPQQANIETTLARAGY